MKKEKQQQQQPKTENWKAVILHPVPEDSVRWVLVTKAITTYAMTEKGS